MSRLLFAAARGARIQEYNASYDTWFDMDTSLPLLHDLTDDYRVNPFDEALQYGPISTALREYAYRGEGDYPYTYMTVVNAPQGSWWMRTDDSLAFERSDELTRSLFLLILAEALADEGL